MSSKPVVLRIVIVLLMLIIGGCDTTTAEPTTEQANPTPMVTAVAPIPETAPTARNMQKLHPQRLLD